MMKNHLRFLLLISLLLILPAAWSSGCRRSSPDDEGTVAGSDDGAAGQDDSSGDSDSDPEEEPQTGSEPGSAASSSTAPASLAHEDLDALLWVRSSAEYAALARQTFRSATARVGTALITPEWTASLEQVEMVAARDGDGAAWLAGLPPAVILDVDETVLNNSGFQMLMIEQDSVFSSESWSEFAKQKTSTAIPGAIDFVLACRGAGVQVLFVTNRDHELEPATRENLIACGLMFEDDEDILFTRGEKEEWTGDKQSRRKELAGQYRILMLVGDDLNDFMQTGENLSPEQRREVARTNGDNFGDRWFMLPNPNYGGWERAAYGWERSISVETQRQRKRETIQE